MHMVSMTAAQQSSAVHAAGGGVHLAMHALVAVDPAVVKVVCAMRSCVCKMHKQRHAETYTHLQIGYSRALLARSAAKSVLVRRAAAGNDLLNAAAAAAAAAGSAGNMSILMSALKAANLTAICC
jgi:hypothetical protein